MPSKRASRRDTKADVANMTSLPSVPMGIGPARRRQKQESPAEEGESKRPRRSGSVATAHGSLSKKAVDVIDTPQPKPEAGSSRTASREEIEAKLYCPEKMDGSYVGFKSYSSRSVQKAKLSYDDPLRDGENSVHHSTACSSTSACSGGATVAKGRKGYLS